MSQETYSGTQKVPDFSQGCRRLRKTYRIHPVVPQGLKTACLVSVDYGVDYLPSVVIAIFLP